MVHDKQNCNMSQDDMPEHQTVVSVSKHKRKPRSSRIGPKQPAEPTRPKSDSHVARLAKKMAKQTTRRLQKTLSSGSNHTVSSFLGAGMKGSRKSAYVISDLSKPKSETYAMMRSPPMTPLVDNTSITSSKDSAAVLCDLVEQCQ